MGTKVFLSTRGVTVDPHEANISVFDRGFLYADAVFETIRTVAGRPVELARHLTRLGKACQALGIVCGRDEEQLAEVIHATHVATGNSDSRIRVVVTRGVGPMGLDPAGAAEPLLVVIAQPLELPTLAAYDRGASAVLVDVARAASPEAETSIKSSSYLTNILALRRAHAEGADEAIMCNTLGDVSEATTSNVFIVRDETVFTPPLEAGILPGITRDIVIELCERNGLTCRQQRISSVDIRHADEVFLTSSVRGIMPVTAIDGRELSNGTMGALTRRLFSAWHSYLQEIAHGEPR